ANLLGSLHLDRGRYIMAALWFKNLIERDGPEKVAATTLLKAAIAYHRIGDVKNREATWQHLASRVGSGLKLGGRNGTPSELRQDLDKFRSHLPDFTTHDRPMFGGNPSRSAQGNGGAPFLEKTWVQPTTQEPPVKNLLDSALRVHESRGLPVLPAYFPIA